MASSSIALPWWQRLPDDFYLRAAETELDAPHRMQVRGTAAIDVVLRTGLGTLIATAMGPALATRSGIARERALLRFYAPYADRGRPEEVFARPSGNVAVLEEDAPWCGFRPAGITSRRLRFESPFTALHPELAASYARFRRNREACALHLVHDDGPRPTLIFLHGYAVDAYFVNGWAFSLPWLHAKGYDVLLATLPFHGDRREWYHPFSGYGFFAGGLAHANEALLHSVFDVHVWMDYLLARGAPAVGVAGLSLGGYIAATLAAVDERLAFSVANSPVVLPVDMSWSGSRRGAYCARRCGAKASRSRSFGT